MQTPFRRPPALLLALLPLLLTTCARMSSDVQLVGRNFDDEVQQTQNLIFTFNRNLVPVSQLDSWDSTQYVRFVPAVRGKFRWTAPNELVFSPAVAFDPATDYRAELTGELGRQTDEKRAVSGEPVAFHTPYLQLQNTEVWWARNRQSGRAEAKARLRFNYAVDAGQVTQSLRLTANDKPLTVQPARADAPANVALTLTDAPDTRDEQPLKLDIGKGLKVPNTTYASKDPVTATATIPAKSRVEIVDVQTSYETNASGQPQGVVRVVTTQELQAGDLKAYFSVQPAVNTTAELTENGFVIRGDFGETDTYVLTLTDQIRGTLGAKLDEPVTRDLFFGQMPASVRFANRKALYLSAKGSRNIGLSLVNVPKVQVQIAKVYDNNILHFLRNRRYENYEEGSDGNYSANGSYNYQQDDGLQYSDLLVNKTVETSDLPRIHGVSALNLALPEAGASKGVYLVSVSAKDKAYLGATQLVSVSDIGLLTKKTAGRMLVWANSIRTAEPLKDVEITLVSNSNQVVMTAKTNGDGLATFEKIDEKLAGFGTPTLVGGGEGQYENDGYAQATGPAVVMLTARTGTASEGDFNFLYLPDTEVETSRFDVGGERDNPSALSAFIYGERNIYRPGETIHLNTVIRADGWKPAADVPVQVRLLLPNGREFQSFRKNTNAQGAIPTDVPLPPAAVTGSYSVEVLNAAGSLLASEQISVEEFIPDRIKVEVRTDRESYKTGQTLTLSATALNLFGPPASDRAYETELQLKRKAFAPSGFGGYDFEIPGASGRGETNSFEKIVRQGRTNDNGQFTEAFDLPGALQDIGLLEGKLFVTVFDENGRPVNRLRRFDILTQDVFYGVRLAGRYVTTNAPLAVELVAVNKDGKLQAGASATVQVIRFDYQTVIEKSGNELKYTSKRREKIVYTNALSFKGGKADFRYVPTVSGEYEVRVRRPSASGYAATQFYAYGYNDTSASSFEVSTEGEVLMTFDKPAGYQTGDRAKVLFNAPFDGKLLVTIERAGVLEHKWLETNNKTAEWTFSVADTYLPNAYVTATLIRPLDNSNLPLTVAHGFAPLPVESADTKLPVTITAVSQSRSKTRQTIKVKAKAGSQVTVAVVDEGILQLKNYKTPDPHGFFYQKRALEVGSYDLYALLFPELSLRSRSSVGGDGYDLEKRVNPLANGRVKLVTYWSGIVETGFSGEAEVTLDIPQFSGDLRIMAVAYKDNAFGAAEQSMKVADPIVISTGLPRFLSPGDALDLPVNLTNTTKKPATVTATLTLTGPLMADSVVSQQLTIPAGRESRALFHLAARQAIGPGAVRITVKGLGETFTDQTEITVRPAVPLVKTTVSGVVAGGKTASLSLTSGFLPGTGKTLVTLSRTPTLQFGREMSYLLGYPHGCMEQTISKAFPQIYFADLTKTLAQTTYFVRAGESDLNPTTNVRSAIQTVENAQLASGGFSMWPGMNEVDNWASAYAVHFLTSAQRAGYQVSGTALAKAIDYLTQHTSAQNMEEVVIYDETGGRTVRKQPSRTNLYGLYVLALAGKPNRAALNYYKQNATSLPADSRYLLAATFARLGDTRSYTALLPKKYSDQTTNRQTANSYASPLRNLALTLDALLEADPDNIQIPQLARQLSGAVRMSSYLNTQEASFALLSLGKLARKNAGSTATATLTGGGKSLGSFTGSDLIIKRVPSGVPLVLSAAGSGNVYYFAQSEGVPAGPTDGVAEEDNGLVVRRSYLDRNGNPVGTFRQNDLVVVKISIASSNGLTVGNVVVTDLLPAGFEVENPRLTELRGTDWLKNPSTGTPDRPDHFDLRDDRVNFYTTATATEKTFYYQARAVSRGRFRLGPVSADAMYNPDYRSYNGAGTVEVL